ncbi:CYTH-like domain-containing protein [Pisolithus croceorrhizus]|nr:CYTH-like domain-containing protein [Pisolithus croceorrhizus]
MNNNNPVNLPPLSVSILGVEPLDEFIREIADFVHHMIMSRPNVGPEARVEVEAKVGVLRDKTSNTRLMLPVLVETILAPNDSDLRFETNMSAAQHKHYNTLLNQLQQQSREPSHPSSPLGYKHVKLVDLFYASENPRDREKIRITQDEKTGTVLEVMTKIRLGDLNIYCPKRTADWRVSVNLEVPVPGNIFRRLSRVCMCIYGPRSERYICYSLQARRTANTYEKERQDIHHHDEPKLSGALVDLPWRWLTCLFLCLYLRGSLRSRTS